MTASKNGMKHKCPGDGRCNLHEHAVFKLLTLCFLLLFLSPTCTANSIVEIGPVNTPHGAVILIVDGLSSSYIYPEYTPYAIDGSELEKARPEKILSIFDQSCRVLDVTAPQTFTEGGHSVLATGYSKADGELVGAYRTTIYDVAHDNDYMAFAIMQKGDSSGMCSKQNVVIHDVDNSINEPKMVTDTNMLSTSDKSISFAVADMMQEHSSILQGILDQYPEGSQERYDAYDIWAIDTGTALVGFMAKEYPEQNYILTINAGAVDSAGHYKKDSGYIATIEGLDEATFELYTTCLENDMAFILTGDHGMAFPTADSRGGHQSDKYSVMTESQKVPFIISAEDVDTGVIQGKFGQEDIAPTILEVLNLHGELRVADGTAIHVKDYVNLRVSLPEEGDIIILRNEETIYQNTNEGTISFMGLESGIEYILRYTSTSEPDNIIEYTIDTGSSTFLDILSLTQAEGSQSTGDGSFWNKRYIAGGVLIVCVNLTGLALIRKILKE
ncbi:sulfatase-like hydrolase/transferase [Methanolobus sp. WCC4]|uniref:sulfatase-like hydrolase/transferase n=1 Tax=Methanolobus sp. WCC4 TaxID=3125784 RepID=UPI0030F95E1A